MIHCTYISFDAGEGDCHIIRLLDGDASYTIMVDCGENVSDHFANTGKMVSLGSGAQRR